MKRILLILTLFILLSNLSYSDNYYPITRDSELMIARGKIAYQNNCLSFHEVNLAGAENWKGLDEYGHRKAPPLNGTVHTWHHNDKILHTSIKYSLVGIVSDYGGKVTCFGDNLNDKDIDAILAYIKSFWPDDYYQH